MVSFSISRFYLSEYHYERFTTRNPNVALQSPSKTASIRYGKLHCCIICAVNISTAQSGRTGCAIVAVRSPSLAELNLLVIWLLCRFRLTDRNYIVTAINHFRYAITPFCLLWTSLREMSHTTVQLWTIYNTTSILLKASSFYWMRRPPKRNEKMYNNTFCYGKIIQHFLIFLLYRIIYILLLLASSTILCHDVLM